MKNKHILNIGLPRCGTSWLWNNLSNKLDPNSLIQNKENNLLFTGQYNQYHLIYSQYAVSANFNTNLWQIDTELIKYIDQSVTHISIIFRNPYNFIERYYDYLPESSSNQFINFMIESRFIDYYEICSRWVDNTDAKFKIFYFEDIVANPKLFLSNYFTFCELDSTITTDFSKVINQNNKVSKIKLDFSNEQIKSINHYIDTFSKLSDRDLSHWTR